MKISAYEMFDFSRFIFSKYIIFVIFNTITNDINDQNYTYIDKHKDG
jgi:hypothetical protein